MRDDVKLNDCIILAFLSATMRVAWLSVLYLDKGRYVSIFECVNISIKNGLIFGLYALLIHYIGGIIALAILIKYIWQLRRKD